MVENAGKGGGKWVGKREGKCIAFELGFCVSVFRLGFSRWQLIPKLATDIFGGGGGSFVRI